MANINKNMKVSRGRLGGFVEDKSKRLYGITCKHVTQVADDGVIYIKSESGSLIQFGQTLQRKRGYDIKRDFDMFMIYDDMVSYCDTTQRNFKGEICKAKIYYSEMSSIYGRKIFMLIMDTSLIIVCSQIATAEVHQRYKIYCGNHEDNVDSSDNVHFLVDPTDLIKPGESGNLIFMESDCDSTIYILGIVIGGDMIVIGTKKYVLCLRFDCGKKYLEERFNTVLNLPKYSTNLGTVSAQKNRNEHVSVGSCIWVKSPEDVAKVKWDFDLLERLLVLVETLAFEEFSASDIKQENNFEKQLNLFINYRKDNLHEITSETPDQTFLLECMKGCENNYSGKYIESETHFKDAVRMITKTLCRNRLLCKLITYVTWLLLDSDELVKMEKLLLGCENYILKMKDCDACSFKYLGYFYHDYSQFHFASGNYKDALCMAEKSLENFQLGEKQQSSVMHEKSFALCMIANANLLCGDKFENRRISAADIKEAEGCVDEMRSFIQDMAVVEKTSYLLVKTDLHFRKGEIEKALKCANKCYDLAIKNNIKYETEQAKERIDELKKVKYNANPMTYLVPDKI